MKKFLLGTLGLVALAAPAVAADLPVAKAPPMAIPVYDWTGFYIGGNVGWGQVNNCWDVDTAGVFTRDSCLNSQGAVVGGQAGYRWQIGPAVFGLEAQGDWANLGRSHISVLDPTIATSSKTSGLGVFTGQIGYSSGPGLFYVKGGAAVTSSTFGLNDAATGIGLAQSIRLVGVAASVPGLSGFLCQTGRWASTGIISSWATRTTRSRLQVRCLPVHSTVSTRKSISSRSASTISLVDTAEGSQRATDRPPTRQAG